MPVTPRERLARVLDGSQAPSAFSAQLSVPARDVRLTVAGAGPISLPVKAPQAKRMIACARPARFGRGEQTLMDLSVRDTWEITPDQVTLTGLDWDAILTDVRDELGLPARARLRAEPHTLLMYGKGQFFLPHQDSEKDDTMIGTLVVSLPSSHTGGELVIEHNDKTVAYQASADEVSVAAFYADCRHEVKPVRTGYRVTFTCNLLLDSDPAGEVPAEPSAEAARYLTEHFTTRVSRWKGDDREPPNRLVYLLDHEYTQRGLSWDRLKGADAERAALLRAAAEDAGCEAVLVLTEIKETWDTEPGRRGRGVDLTYIITSELTLSWWTGTPGGEPISLYVPDEQVCASTPSADLKPYDSEFTGYMGSYGNTMDRWYRRAAVVVWPRQHAFAARAEASPSWTLTELRARLDAGDLVNARAAAESVAPFWKAPGPGLLEPALHTAAGLEDPGIALMLLRPFAVEWVTPGHAGGLAELAARYGESWHRNLLDAWFGSRNTWRYTGDVDRKGWAGALPGLTAALRDAGAAAAAGWLLAASCFVGADRRLGRSAGRRNFSGTGPIRSCSVPCSHHLRLQCGRAVHSRHFGQQPLGPPAKSAQPVIPVRVPIASAGCPGRGRRCAAARCRSRIRAGSTRWWDLSPAPTALPAGPTRRPARRPGWRQLRGEAAACRESRVASRSRR
jgi:hypothetical protein